MRGMYMRWLQAHFSSNFNFITKQSTPDHGSTVSSLSAGEEMHVVFAPGILRQVFC